MINKIRFRSLAGFLDIIENKVKNPSELIEQRKEILDAIALCRKHGLSIPALLWEKLADNTEKMRNFYDRS